MRNVLRLLLMSCVGMIGSVGTASAQEDVKQAAAPLEFRIVAEKDASDASAIHTDKPDVPYLPVAVMLDSLAEDGPDDSPDARFVWRKIAKPAQFLNLDNESQLSDAEAVRSHSPMVVGVYENEWYVLLHDEDGMKMVTTPGKASSWSVVSAKAVPARQGETFAVEAAVDEQGGKLLSDLTKHHVGQRICICIGGEAVSSATIRDAVGKTFVITGDFDEARAKEFARVLLQNPAAMIGMPQRKAE